MITFFPGSLAEEREPLSLMEKAVDEGVAWGSWVAHGLSSREEIMHYITSLPTPCYFYQGGFTFPASHASLNGGSGCKFNKFSQAGGGVGVGGGSEVYCGAGRKEEEQQQQKYINTKRNVDRSEADNTVLVM